MKKLFQLSFLVLSFSAFAQEDEAPKSVKSLAWLTGTWRSESAAEKSEMTFNSPEAGLLMGTNRSVSEGKVTFAEFIRFEEDERGQLFLKPYPFFLLKQGKVDTTFELKEMTTTKVVFENETKEFPRVISYELKANGHLVNRVEGTQLNKETQKKEPISFETDLVKQQVPQIPAALVPATKNSVR
jgi:hypothetical protein